MELDFDADFVKAEEESLGTLVRRNSKADRGRNLKENVANDTVKPEMNMDFVTSGGENIAINSATSSLEKAANMTCKGETKMNANFASSDEESSSTLVLNTSELNTGRNLKENVTNGCKTIIGEIEAGFIEVENREVNLGGKSFEAEQSQVTKVEHSERHENKEYFNGGSSAYPPSVDPSNKSAVLTEMPVDSTHLKASLQSSVYYVEDTGLWKCRHCSWVYPGTNPGVEFIQKHKEHCEGSQINANLDRGSETIDYESKETEFVMSEMVSQTMTEKQNDQKWPSAEGIREIYYTDSETSTGAYVTQSILTGKFNQIENIKNEKSAFLDSHIFSEIGSTATVRDEGLTSNECQDKEENSVIKENHHWNGVFKTVLQQSQDVFLREKDEKQLRENQIRILEKSALEGNVEDIVKILKEQQSHDLVCPNCGSCITKRVILRKRKRTSLVSEGNTDVRAAVSEEEDEITGDQSNRPDIEHVEETEAFGCLACFSLFFQRVVPGVKFFQTKSGSGNNSLAEQYPSENLQDSRMLLEKEKDSFYCFPFIYPWGHSKPGDKLKEPLLNKQYSEKGKALALDESDSYGRLESGAKADYAIETSQRKSGKEAESIPKTMSSESNLRIVDALHQNVALSAIPTTTIGTGILLKNDGEKTTAVNEVGLDEDHTVAENVKLDSLLNVSDKDDDAVKEFTEKLPNRAASHSNITIQNIATYTSTTTKSTLTYSSRVDNVEIKETNYTATETTKTTPYLNGDSESLQLEEQYPRLPNLEVTEGRFKIPPSISIPALNDQTGQVEAKLEVPNESVSEEISDRHVQHADKLAESKQLEKQHVYQKDVKGTEDHLTELSFSASSALSEEHQQSKTEQHYVYASSKHVDKVPSEIETSMDENRIRPQLVTQGEASNGMPDTAGNKELLRSEHQPNDLERNMVVGKAQSDKKDYLCSCIPVSIPTIWSMWSSKELIADEQLKKPLLADPENKLTIDKEVPVALRVVPGVKFFRTKSEHGNNSLAKQYSSENLQDSRMLVDKEKDSFYCFPFYPWGHNKQGVTADYAIEASQRKRGEDAPHQNVALNAVPTTTTGAGILLKNDGEKTTTVNEVGLDEDHTVAGNVNLDSQLNLSDKDDDTVEEFTEKPPNRAASHPNITIQSITSHTSTTATSRVNNVKIKETSYTATGTTKTTSCLDGDSEFLQQEEQYPRLPNIEVTEGRLGIPTSSSIPALNDGQNVQAEAKFEVPKENVTEKTSDRHVQHASDTAGNNVLPRSGSDEKDYLCSCIPVSLPTIWSWSSKELIADEQLKKPLLADLKDKLTIDEEVLVTLRDDQQRKVIFPSKVDSVESSSSLETQDPATLVQKKVDDSVRLNKVDDSVSQSSEISPDSSNIASPTDGRAAVVINIRQSANTEAADPGVVTDWDLLKSIVYGGLTVSITSLGVVSSAAGGDAKTLTVIAISLANLVAGFFLIIKDILYLHHFDKIKFEDSVGHSFLFNGFIAIVSYLVFGSLAPITYGFSFQNSDDTLYKFLAASLVSLISIILLALGKARVANKSYNIVAQEAYKTYIRVVILYVVTGFWASFIGFFAGKYIKKLLEKWGFTTD